MVILGLDPGTATTGYGIISAKSNSCVEVLDYGTIDTSAKTAMPARLLQIHKTLKKLIKKFKPDGVSIEEIFFNTNDKTAVVVSQARGVLLLTCALAGKKFYEYTPLQVKCALCSYGRAEKRQVDFMVRKTLHLPSEKIRDDAVDALALALTHLYSYNEIDVRKP